MMTGRRPRPEWSGDDSPPRDRWWNMERAGDVQLHAIDSPSRGCAKWRFTIGRREWTGEAPTLEAAQVAAEDKACEVLGALVADIRVRR